MGEVSKKWEYRNTQLQWCMLSGRLSTSTTLSRCRDDALLRLLMVVVNLIMGPLMRGLSCYYLALVELAGCIALSLLFFSENNFNIVRYHGSHSL